MEKKVSFWDDHCLNLLFVQHCGIYKDIRDMSWFGGKTLWVLYKRVAGAKPCCGWVSRGWHRYSLLWEFQGRVYQPRKAGPSSWKGDLSCVWWWLGFCCVLKKCAVDGFLKGEEPGTGKHFGGDAES